MPVSVVLLLLVVAAVVAAGVAVLVMSRAQRDRSVSTAVTAEAMAAAASEAARAATSDLGRQLAFDLHEQQRLGMSSAVEHLVTVAGEKLGAQSDAGRRELEGTGERLGAQLGEMRTDLQRVSELVATLERSRKQRDGELGEQLRNANQATAELGRTTTMLQQTLAGSRTRGQWGERMAEDVLRLAGFIEGINYVKQTAIAGGTIPDYSFHLPGDRMVHMDVKFPLDNYMRSLDADTEVETDRLCKAFLRDVRDRIGELKGRGYVDPNGGTVDHVLLFIPNEQVFAYINEHDHEMLDHALRQRVVLCSPQTLFVVLSIIRQAVDNFALDRASNEVLDLLAGFSSEWDKYVAKVDQLGKRLDSVRNAYDDLEGPRRRMLQRQLDKIDQVRHARGLTELDEDPDSAALPGRTTRAEAMLGLDV